MEETKAAVEAEVSTTDTQNVDMVSSPDKKKQKQMSRIDEIVYWTAQEITGYARNADRETVRRLTTDVLSTVFNMCSLDEYAIGPKVDGEVYRYSDYEGQSTLGQLLIAKKIVASDVISAIDFLDHKAFETSHQSLPPSTFKSACKQLATKLRVNPNMVPFSRPSVELLGDATKYAVNGRKVVDRNADHILFLIRNFDDEARDLLTEWCKSLALRLASDGGR